MQNPHKLTQMGHIAWIAIVAMLLSVFPANARKVKTAAATPIAPATQAANQILERANALYLQGKYSQAVLLYRKAADRGADPVACAFNSGNSWFRLDKLPAAAASFRKAVDLSYGEYLPALNNLAAVLFRLGDYPASIAAYDRSLRQDPDNLSGWLFLAEACGHNGDPVCAQRALENAIRLDPDDIGTTYQLAEVHVRMGEYDNAVDLVHAAYARAPQETDFLVYAGDILRMAKRPDEAAAEYRQALGNRPDDTELMYKLADVLADDDKGYLAMDILAKALAIKPDFGDAAIFLGNLASDAKWWDKAESAYLQAGQAGHPEAVQGLRNLAYEYQQRKLPERSVELIRKAIGFAPDDASLKLELEQFQEEAGQSDPH